MGKAASIIIGILLIVIGIFAFFSPFITAISFEWIATVGFLVLGIYEILSFIFIKPRSGWQLADGIINVILGILLLTSGIEMRAETFSFIFAILFLFSGIEGLSFSSMTGSDSNGWIIFTSILAIIAAIFMFFVPSIFTTLTIGYLFGIYILIGGITLISWGASKHS